MRKTTSFVTSFYDGPSPKCLYCQSEKTSNNNRVNVPEGAMVDFSPNIIIITCKNCGKKFEYIISQDKCVPME